MLFERARNSFVNHLVALCVLSSWMLILSIQPPAHADSAESRYQIARTEYYKLINSKPGERLENDWLNCVSLFRKVWKSYPKTKRAADALFSAALLYSNMHQRFDKLKHIYGAIEAYDLLIQQHPSSTLADDSYYNKAIIYIEDLGDQEQGLLILSELRTRFPKSEMTNQAIELQKRLTDSKQADLEPQYYQPKTDSSSDQPTGPNRVNDIRFWSNPDFTRVSIYTKHDPKFIHKLLKKDPKLKTSYRLYVDVYDAKLSSKVRKQISISDSLLEGVRSGQNKPDTTRVVLDMNSLYDYQVTAMEDPYRIVIDIQGKKPLSTKAVSAEATKSEPVEKPTAINTETAKNDKKQKVKNSDDLIVDLSKTSDRNRLRTVVIDPGHGGDDPGAKGPSGLLEKRVALEIAKLLKIELEKNKSLKVVMTRSTDIFIPLPKRSEIANTERGDIFVSIHANASRKRQASGVSTYVFDNATDTYSKNLEAIENASILNGEKEESDFLSLMFKSMTKNYFTNQSVELAALVQKSMVNQLRGNYKRVRDLGVKQARFYVLWNTEMPSILVETSFISNRREEQRLKSKFYQQRIAASIARGLKGYLEHKTNTTRVSHSHH